MPTTPMQLKEMSRKPLGGPEENVLLSEGTGISPALSKAVLSFEQLLALPLPERKRHLSWLPEGGNVMVFGRRGIGKTMFELGLAVALTTGTSFLRWKVESPVGVLYVDGEMQLSELRERTAALTHTPPSEAMLQFLTSEWVYHTLKRDLVLTSEAMRVEIMEILDTRPEIRVVILDNIACLFSGIDEDSKRDWEPINAWLIRLRHRGLATVLVHHAGKGGQQRGTSGREDSLDTVIQLEQPAGYDPQEGCHFELNFTKSRSVKGQDVESLDVRLNDDENRLQWVWKALEVSKGDQVRRLVAEGVTSPTDIAEELGMSKGYASKLVRKIKGQ